MNLKAKRFLKNFAYALVSNATSLLISVIITLILPKLLGVREYSYWQLYLFYVNYVGVFHLGWNDGIYLRYGGKSYDSLDRDVFFTEFVMQVIMQAVCAATILIIGSALSREADRTLVIRYTAVCLIATNLRYFFLYILQATNRIREYSIVTIFDRVLYLGLILAMMLLGSTSLSLAMTMEVTGRIASLILAMWYCRNLVAGCVFSFAKAWKEMLANIAAGIKLLISNLASNLIIGAVRFGIENKWDIETFGRVSLMISISNFAVTFINAVGIVVYPVLRNVSKETSREIFGHLNRFLTPVLYVFLFLYYPLAVFVSYWLPDYAQSVPYIAILLPLCIYEGKMALLYNTYLKTFRKEKQMMLINLISLGVSVAGTGVTVYLMQSLDAAVFLILLVVMLRALICEAYVSHFLKIPSRKTMVSEVLLTLIFSICNMRAPAGAAVCVYLVVYAVVLLLSRRELKASGTYLKAMLRQK